jgi:hypothetical protein
MVEGYRSQKEEFVSKIRPISNCRHRRETSVVDEFCDK